MPLVQVNQAEGSGWLEGGHCIAFTGGTGCCWWALFEGWQAFPCKSPSMCFQCEAMEWTRKRKSYLGVCVVVALQQDVWV